MTLEAVEARGSEAVESTTDSALQPWLWTLAVVFSS